MRLGELFEGVPYTGSLPDAETDCVVMDSRKVRPGCVFVCTRGRISDGHSYAAAALDAGAVLVVCDHPLGLRSEVVTADTQQAYALLSENYFGNPARRLHLIAVTGTNGKTTVAFLIRSILEASGRPCGLIGTVRSEIGPLQIPARFTTPEAWDLAALFARMVRAGCTHAVLEASSQALAQQRLYGLTFDVGVFTNLTQDHLDYHGTMENYYQAKRSLFSQTRAAVIDLDDPYGARLRGEIPAQRVLTVSASRDEADITARGIRMDISGVQFEMVGREYIHRVRFAMPGGFSVQNALAAAGAAVAAGVSPRDAAGALTGIRGVPGRCEVLASGKITVISDFAHTGGAIESVLSGLRPFIAGHLVVLFGCAGQRDAGKRPAMAEAVLKYADRAVLTSDNPRGENEQKIFDDVLPIFRRAGFPLTVEPDRRIALREALDSLGTGDVLILCGKGHEDYQALADRTIYLDEHRIVRGWLRQHGMTGSEI